MRTVFYNCCLLAYIFAFHTELTGEETDSAWNETLTLPALKVYSPKTKTAAGKQVVRDKDLALRPIHNPSDIIKVTPGLYTANHAGGGKAYQYFMRGFDIDHGTDLAFWIDGVPINNVSHGHGQGYTDLHFIIPETIDKLEVFKGPYHAQFGDFTTAGALRLKTKRAVESSVIKISGGSFNTGRILAITSFPNKKDVSPYIAFEVYRADGPFENPENLERYNLMLKTPLLLNEESELFLTAMSYGGGWNGSGQIPGRAVESGLITRWGSLDPTEGGGSQRNSLSLDYTRLTGDKSFFQTNVYYVLYRLGMYSNFTFNLQDSLNGDQIEQLDRRHIFGFNSEYFINNKLLGLPLTSRIGFQNRNDLVNTELGNSVTRRRTSTKIDSDIRESGNSVYIDEFLSPAEWITLNLGMRGDLFTFDVNDNISTNEFNTDKTSGITHKSVGSPKGNVIVSPLKNLDFFINIGRGFHSNDARGVVILNNPVSPVAKALGYELGFRILLWDRLNLAGDIWKLDLESELVWIGDEGTTEPSGESERFGADLETRFNLAPWLWLDGDISISRGVFSNEPENANTVPNAPNLMSNAGISWQHPKGYFGSLRHTILGDRPLAQDESITGNGFSLVNLNAGYRKKRWEVSAQIENIFNTEYAATQFATESRLKSETTSVEEVHYVPGNPINFKVQVGMTY